jgi:hypothetical protein
MNVKLQYSGDDEPFICIDDFKSLFKKKDFLSIRKYSLISEDGFIVLQFFDDKDERIVPKSKPLKKVSKDC